MMVSDRQVQNVVNGFQQVKEITSRLNGDFGVGGKAVTVDNLSQLNQIPTEMKSKFASGPTPTKEEYDSLVSDLRIIHAMLVEISRSLVK